MNLSDDHLKVLRHMLGIDVVDRRAPKEYRNYYCATPGDPLLLELLDAGMVIMYRKCDQYEWFTATEAGKVAARASQQAQLKPKAARVYSRFLSVKECLPDMTFRDFLTNPDFADARREA